VSEHSDDLSRRALLQAAPIADNVILIARLSFPKHLFV